MCLLSSPGRSCGPCLVVILQQNPEHPHTASPTFLLERRRLSFTHTSAKPKAHMCSQGQCCWSVAAKARNKPLHELFGNTVSASQKLEASILEAKAAEAWSQLPRSVSGLVMIGKVVSTINLPNPSIIEPRTQAGDVGQMLSVSICCLNC